MRGEDMPTVLSTKKLTENQRNLLLQAGIGLVEYDAISIEVVDFEVEDTIENAIITSQNMVKSLVEKKFKLKLVFVWEKNPKQC